jgi:dihydrofolate reductase
VRKLILGEDLTLDGVVEANEKWRFAFAGGDLAAYDVEKVNSIDAMLMGRNTYEIFRAFWPAQKHNEFGIADKLNDAPKFVVSTTLKSADWQNTTVISESVEQAIIKLKNSQGGDIGIAGSITLAQWLMQHKLIDEYHLLTFPLVLGSGRRLFRDGINIPLELIDSKAFASGVVLSRYRPASRKP